MSKEKNIVPRKLKDFLIECSPDLKICDSIPGYFDEYFLKDLLKKQGDFFVSRLLIDERLDKCDLFRGLIDFGFDVTQPVRSVSLKRAIRQLPEEIKEEVKKNPFVKFVSKNCEMSKEASIPLFSLINKSCSEEEQEKIYDIVNEKEFPEDDLKLLQTTEEYCVSEKELRTICRDCEALSFRRNKEDELKRYQNEPRGLVSMFD